ncbi:Shedu anti-phage system protein SduA domain-containing protein [uncultured Methylobacterium sp.]|jgi:hypothetical protein|uniref:Shedu anti-phage system protein SduA domain-containing protein n=1 Tax=uncultured Methylobacterium sp. TaxID=157278 RepID=UPI002602B48D|nr:Shedu anti-phage system protein SduA domain-containing protein [uncultured Methylobacterium sp.]
MSVRPAFGETEAVREIKARHLRACLLAYTIIMPAPDRYRFEFGLKGLFRADLVVGNDKARKFVLVEFEDGRADSLFKGGTSRYRAWSPRLEHGFGQIIDWAWAKHSHPTDAAFTNSFGGRVVEDCYVVVCGRSPERGSLEEQRFDFRRSIKFNGIAAQIYTYDDMVDAMSDNLAGLLAR